MDVDVITRAQRLVSGERRGVALRAGALRIVGASVVLTASGCGAPGENAGTVSSAIIGGTDDTGDPAVVAIVSESLNFTLCSGALVGPRTVLTAGHCYFTDISVRFGENASAPQRTVLVTTTLQHPSFTKAGAPYDFALLELDTAVTDVAPLELRKVAPDARDVGKTTIRHVGFGVSNEAAGTGSGHKRTVSYPITKVTDVLVYSGAPGKQTCEDDSGAPGLVRDGDGVERIAGVTSDGPSCHEDGWDGRADLASLQSFVADTRAMWEAPPPEPPSGGCSAAAARAPRDARRWFAALVWLAALASWRRRRRRSSPAAS